MSARCETIGKFVLPVFRALVAKELVNTYGLTQMDAAHKLGTTQAAISQYLNSKRAMKGVEQFSNMLPKLRVMAKTTAEQLVKQQMTYKDVSLDFCKLCVGVCPSQPAQTGDDYAI